MNDNELVRPPFDGTYMGRAPDHFEFSVEKDGTVTVLIDAVTIIGPTQSGTLVRETRLSTRKDKNRNRSSAGDYLKACYVSATPRTNQEWIEAINSTAGRPFHFDLDQFKIRGFRSNYWERLPSTSAYHQPKMSRSHKFISVVLLGLLGLWAAIDQLAQRSRAFDPGPCLGARATEPGCAETAERLVLALAFPNAIPRLEPLRDSGLDIYLTRQQFESVPFPDRETVVRNIGSAWCDHVSLVRLPEVRLRDVRTGEEFGSFGCEFGR